MRNFICFNKFKAKELFASVLRKNSLYIQGQLDAGKKGAREYFFYIDHMGQVCFLESVFKRMRGDRVIFILNYSCFWMMRESKISRHATKSKSFCNFSSKTCDLTTRIVTRPSFHTCLCVAVNGITFDVTIYHLCSLSWTSRTICST